MQSKKHSRKNKQMIDLEVSVCWACVCGIHDECYDPQLIEDDNVAGPWTSCCCRINKDQDAHDYSLGVGRPVADPGQITDITSTGRRRAAMLYPIMENMVCEWAGLKFAGGGVEPIIGCQGNILTSDKGPTRGDRHHGPDKNVINNSPGNVHRICSSCHNSWHSKNNKYYGERPAADQSYLPTSEWIKHDDETLATEEELEEAASSRHSQNLKHVDTED